MIENPLEPCDKISASLEMRGRNSVDMNVVYSLVTTEHFLIKVPLHQISFQCLEALIKVSDHQVLLHRIED